MVAKVLLNISDSKNERIKELALQASLPIEEYGPEYASKLERFAELIVLGCAAVCEPIPGLPFGPEAETARYGCLKDIKKYFAVDPHKNV